MSNRWMVVVREDSYGAINNNHRDNDDNKQPAAAAVADVDDDDDDDNLVASVSRSFLISLCQQYNLPIPDSNGVEEDDKILLLQTLRQFATNQASFDRQRKVARVDKVDRGQGDCSQERYEIVGTENEDETSRSSIEDDPDIEDEEDGFFYFAIPSSTMSDTLQSPANNNTHVSTATDSRNHSISGSSTTPKSKSTATTQRSSVIAPPPPKHKNENGERVVTVYSTDDKNDWTAAIPPNEMPSSSMDSSSSDFILSKSKQKTTEKHLTEAKTIVTELVRTLLVRSGAPAFQEWEELEDMDGISTTTTTTNNKNIRIINGFDPSTCVPPDMLESASSSLRAGRGTVLSDVLRESELYAIGHDGMAGDDVSRGGGNYRQVQRIRAFLEGYRHAEVKRIARETTTMLLDRLATEGIQGLDRMLSTMVQSSDDTGTAGELTDSLLEFLNDAIRQQETRLGDISPRNMGADSTIVKNNNNDDDDDEYVDEFSHLWNVSLEKGERIETLDPKDPMVQKVMKEQWDKHGSTYPTDPSSTSSSSTMMTPIPKSAPEKLLLILQLLRNRLLLEAAFSSSSSSSLSTSLNNNDNEPSNFDMLRLLAYTLRLDSKDERQAWLRRELYQSVDKMDAFQELVTSAIQYVDTAASRPRTVLPPILCNRSRLQEIKDYIHILRTERIIPRP